MSAAQIVRNHPDGAMLTVWVVPGARRTEIAGYYGDALRLRVAEPAERGRANKAVIEFMERSLQCRIRLAGGAGSRRKRLVAVGVSIADLRGRVERAAN